MHLYEERSNSESIFRSSSVYMWRLAHLLLVMQFRSHNGLWRGIWARAWPVRKAKPPADARKGKQRSPGGTRAGELRGTSDHTIRHPSVAEFDPLTQDATAKSKPVQTTLTRSRGAVLLQSPLCRSGHCWPTYSRPHNIQLEWVTDWTRRANCHISPFCVACNCTERFGE